MGKSKKCLTLFLLVLAAALLIGVAIGLGVTDMGTAKAADSTISTSVKASRITYFNVIDPNKKFTTSNEYYDVFTNYNISYT